MADLAIGLSKTAVEILKKKFDDAVKEEQALWQTVMRDFVFITDEFEMMQSFFNTADAECVKNNVVRTWVRQVRDLSYDAEDWIESVKFLDPNPGRLVWCNNILRRMIRNNCLCFRLCCEAGAAQSPDEAAAGITLLKARVEEVRQRSLRYNLLSEPAVAEMHQAAAGNSRRFDVLVKATEDDDANERSAFLSLTWLIKKESSKGLLVISVWATEDDAGVADTIKEAYDDLEISRNFRCAWVRLMGPFSPHEFMQSVVAQVRGQVIVEPNHLKDVFDDIITHKYFIVIEGISSMEQWHAFRAYLTNKSGPIPNPNTPSDGSRIVVSTQHLDIARSGAGHRHQALEIKQFSDNHSVWALKSVQQDNFVNRTYFVRRDSYEQKLFNLLDTKKTTFGIYNVWRLTGVGKSVLVKAVYDRCLSERKGDYSKCAWVDVPYPLNLLDFCKTILDKLSASQSSTYDGPIRQCQILLNTGNLLLVIDGVRSKEDWALINSNILTREPGSSGQRKNFIIITTTVNIRATVGNPESYYVPGLQEDEALVLFNEVFRTTAILTRDMLKEARRILPECRGLPHVIIGIATHLTSLFRGNRATREPEWKCLCANISYLEAVGIDHASDLHSRLENMHSSFNSCAPALKKFILYLLVFPEKTAIRLRRLIRRWVALGLFMGTDSQSLEEEADDFIKKLAGADMSVIRAPRESSIAGERRMTSCQVDPFVFRYFISRLKEDSNVLPLEVSVLSDVKQEEKEKTGRIGVHLAVRKEWRRDSCVFDQLNLKRVRSLTVAGKWEQFFVSADRMSALRVLDLEDAPSITDDDLGNIGKLPPSLRFFSLRGCKGIRSLPDTLELGKLTHLQTLDISGTYIDRLPADIIKLRELEYVGAGRLKTMDTDDDGSSNDGVKLPRGIKHLAALKTLGVVDVRAAPDSGKATLKEIRSLQGLKKLKVSGISRADSPRLHKALACLTNLESLSLKLHKDDSCRCNVQLLPWHDISPPPTVRSLKLHGHVQVLPKNLGHLTRLSLEMTTVFSQAVIEALGSLEKLVALHLRVTRLEHGVLQFPAGVRFSGLRNLQITCHSILHVKFDKETMEKVELVMVRTFPGSSLQFSGLQNLTSLKQFWLDGTCRSDDALREALQKQLEKHAKNPALNMETAMWRNFWSI